MKLRKVKNHGNFLKDTYCPLCQSFLSERVKQFGDVARNAILYPKDDKLQAFNAEENADEDDEEIDDACSCEDDGSDSNTFQCSNPDSLHKIEQTIRSLNCTMFCHGQVKLPSLPHRKYSGTQQHMPSHNKDKPSSKTSKQSIKLQN